MLHPIDELPAKRTKITLSWSAAFETKSKMIGISGLTLSLLLLSLVNIFQKADCWCDNSETSQHLKFQWLKENNTENLMFLLEGFQLQIQCCVVSTNPSVSWLFNGKPISEFGDIFELSEKDQVLQSANEALINTTALQGVYNCTAVEGNETISAAYMIKWVPTGQNPCSQAQTTDVELGHPPSSLFEIVSNSSLTLECAVLLTCHPFYGYQEIYWEKYYVNYAANATQPNSDNTVTAYMLFDSDPYDNTTSDYVNVTTRKLSYGRVLVTSTLYIANITDEDLRDPYNPDSYEYLSCENNATDCGTNRTKNYYRCGYLGSDTVNPLQNALTISRTVRLFRGARPTSPPKVIIFSEVNRMEREGVIIGSTIGAAFILVSIFALLFVAYEWHLKLYIRRVLLQLRRNSRTMTANYEYNCYVACCIKDDKFVYEVLRCQMEEQYGYRLCLPERDFSIGTAIPDEIERCIRSSEYFVAVISPDFWETAWCNLSVDLALRTNAKVVAVITKELSEDQRDKSSRLMTALKTPGCTIIKSSLLTHESSWEKLVLRLRYAMPKLDSI